ncbi:hypothetical protein [uncultured Jannaschia sp.]|uniref:hypothetical protein n=1 Tax=uncultured Jannaschia sp. TaxID=293347 RepID=UPI002629D856|nr:hypothetical protein [uncultured Jannaschia sp.]
MAFPAGIVRAAPSSEIELPDGLPKLYRETVAVLAAKLSKESVAGRAADELHDLVDRIVVQWDDNAHRH